MSDSAILEKTGELSGKVDFTPISPPKENATEGGELHELGVDDEPAIDDAEDGEGVKQGE